MAERTEYPADTFCWVDLATTDPAAARSFYGDLLGWGFLDVATDMGTTYSLATLETRQVAAIQSLPPKPKGQTPQWSSYVAVDSADEAATRAGDLGGTVVVEPFDVMTAGRMAVLRDPGGAVISVWEARDHFGAALVNQHGALCWNELMTHDTAASASFYTDLFNWSTEPFGDSYTIFMNGARPAGGMIRIDTQTGAVPPNWSVYFHVDDCDGVHDHAITLGGKVCMPPADYPEVGRGCVLSDPQGAEFAVIRLLNPPD